MGKAASLFNGAGPHTLINRVTPTGEQREFLQVQWSALAEHLRVNLTEKSGFPVHTWLQGSYKYGTVIRPVQPDDEYDVDVGIYFEWLDSSAGMTAQQLRELVQAEVALYQARCSDILKVETPAKERCSRAIYSGKFHIDVPVYHYEPKKGKRRLACLSGTWEESDPKAFYQWFKGKVDADNRELVRRLVRYLKAWASIAFENAPEARPSSIFLTVLVAEAFASVSWKYWSIPRDDDALIAVVKEIFSRLHKSSFVACPVDERENLNRISLAAWSSFMIRLRCLHEAVLRAEHAMDEMNAALAWSEVFSFLMPLPSIASVEFVDEGSTSALLPVPDIDIAIISPNARRAAHGHRNSISGVCSGSTLYLSLVRPSELPDHATVEWTVRYADEVPNGVGVLGMREIGVRATTTKIFIRYTGLHQISCVISVNGRVYAVRNVQVLVCEKGEKPPASLPLHKDIRCMIKRKLSFI